MSNISKRGGTAAMAGVSAGSTIPRQAPGNCGARPFADLSLCKPQNATFEGIHASLAERRGPNAACVPAPYDCPGLGGVTISAKLAPLSPLEQQLKWTPAQTGVSPASQRPRPTLLTRLLKDLGGG